MNTTSVKPAARKRNSFLVNIYLFIYNWIHTAVWSYVVGLSIWRVIESRSIEGFSSIYRETEPYVLFILVFVFIEIIHDEIGIVPAPQLNILVRLHCKVLRRAIIYILTLYFLPSIQNHPASGIVLFFWGLIDIVRYPFYALNTFKVCPYWLIWARYSEFIVLYPISFIAEIYLWYLMLLEIRATKLHSFPITPNLDFDYFYPALGYLLYRLGSFPVNFIRLWKMRQRRLYPSASAGKTTDKTE